MNLVNALSFSQDQLRNRGNARQSQKNDERPMNSKALFRECLFQHKMLTLKMPEK